MEFKGVKLPDNLCETIRKESIDRSRLGLYNGTEHTFLTPTLDPNDRAISRIREVYGSYPYLREEDFTEIVSQVLDQTNVYASSHNPQALDLTGVKGLAALTYVVVEEENDARTDLIYLGQSRFLVLSTSRSSIHPEDILEARKSPVAVGEATSFNVYRDNTRFKPAGYGEYDPAFKMKWMRIVAYSEPDLYAIIDMDPRFGGALAKAGTDDVEPALVALSLAVKDGFADMPESLPEREVYPGYSQMLETAMSSGIPSYILNLVIEALERNRDVDKPDDFVEVDWDKNMTPKQIRDEKEKERKRLQREAKKNEDALAEELKKVKRRTVFFFDRPGVISEESRQLLDRISVDLDRLADAGYGSYPKGYAAAQIKAALDNSKPRPRHNLKVGVILAGVLALLVFSGYSFVTAKNALSVFEQDRVAIEQLIGQGSFSDNGPENFLEAGKAIEAARARFRPGYLRFLVSGDCRNLNRELNATIDENVEQVVASVEAMTRANRGRIDDFCWELIKNALEFRPENGALLELRQQYINQ